MTTIACNAECMASDTAVTNSGPMYHADKIFRIGISLYGTAGDGFMALAFLDWKRRGQAIQTLHKMIPVDNRGDIRIMELRQGRIYLWDGWGIAEPIHEKFYAIGSGSLVAIAELARNVSPADAVKAATRWDEYTHAPIHVEMLKPVSQKKRKR